MTGSKMTSLEEFVKALLRCTICNEFMQPHIRLCTNGHSACNTCVEKYSKCVKCKYPFLTTRNKALEELASEVNVKCDICGISFSAGKTLEHRNQCQLINPDYKIYKCLKEIIRENYSKFNCPWSGCLDEIFGHFRKDHPTSVYETKIAVPTRFEWKLPFSQDQLDINVLLVNNDKFIQFVFFEYQTNILHFIVSNITNKRKFIFQIQMNENKLIGKTTPITVSSFVEIRTLIRTLHNPVTVNVAKGTSKQNNDFKDYQRPIAWVLTIYNSVGENIYSELRS